MLHLRRGHLLLRRRWLVLTHVAPDGHLLLALVERPVHLLGAFPRIGFARAEALLAGLVPPHQEPLGMYRSEEPHTFPRHPRQIEMAAAELRRDPTIGGIAWRRDDALIGRCVRARVEPEVARLQPVQRRAREWRARPEPQGLRRSRRHLWRLDLVRNAELGIEPELTGLQDLQMRRRRRQRRQP